MTTIVKKMPAAAVQWEEWLPRRDKDKPYGYSFDLSSAIYIVMRDGNFTYVVLKDYPDGIVMGLAKRNPGDDPDMPERGERLAAIRAWRMLRDLGWQ